MHRDLFSPIGLRIPLHHGDVFHMADTIAEAPLRIRRDVVGPLLEHQTGS